MEAADKLDQDEGDNLVENGTSTVTVEPSVPLLLAPARAPHLPAQCIQGHVVCSPCREKVIAGAVKKCKACGVAVGSYQIRCRDMERVVESVRVACAHASHGCVARVTYYDRRRHGKACPYAPYGCPRLRRRRRGAPGPLVRRPPPRRRRPAVLEGGRR
ncbi:hypothetical protein HU200_007932 [Digitaria exilis]|uniref:SIAH-type domain-containing protein n=1 Tax=Digitaria exilis TaxID=1010633 RepID=A0A835FLZ1_9POAL|nr:hypothetical protein HU200_007932 [Digitaria exilis]